MCVCALGPGFVGEGAASSLSGGGSHLRDPKTTMTLGSTHETGCVNTDWGHAVVGRRATARIGSCTGLKTPAPTSCRLRPPPPALHWPTVIGNTPMVYLNRVTRVGRARHGATAAPGCGGACVTALLGSGVGQRADASDADLAGQPGGMLLAR